MGRPPCSKLMTGSKGWEVRETARKGAMKQRRRRAANGRAAVVRGSGAARSTAAARLVRAVSEERVVEDGHGGVGGGTWVKSKASEMRRAVIRCVKYAPRLLSSRQRYPQLCRARNARSACFVFVFYSIIRYLPGSCTMTFAHSLQTQFHAEVLTSPRRTCVHDEHVPLKPRTASSGQTSCSQREPS